MDVLNVSFDRSKEILDTVNKAKAEQNRNISRAKRNIAIAEEMLAEATKAVGIVESFDGRVMKTYLKKHSAQVLPTPQAVNQSSESTSRQQSQAAKQKPVVSQGPKDSAGSCGVVKAVGVNSQGSEDGARLGGIVPLVEDEILPDHDNPPVDNGQDDTSQGAGGTDKAANCYWSRAILQKAKMAEMVRQSKLHPAQGPHSPLQQDQETADSRRMRLPPLLDGVPLLQWNTALERPE